MQSTNNFIRRLMPTVVLALVVLVAFGAGSAGAAGAPQFVPGVTDFPSRLGVIGERAAEARLAEAQQGSSITVAESGFDWTAGVTGAMAATLLLVGAVLAVRTAKRGRIALG